MGGCVPRAYRIVDNYLALILLVLLMFLPVYGPLMTQLEGQLLPVTSKVTIIADEAAPGGGRNIRFSYVKHRACEIVGTSLRIGEQEVGFEPAVNDNMPRTRLPGQQVSRLWHVSADDLTGVELWFTHRCHIFWLTSTQVFP